MRTNLPVTQQEYDYPADMTLISVTDVKGRITYCNPNFVSISGYSREELQGQPHNIVRHPDMPEEAFRDLWDTIERGLPWTALVKNRRKTGEHYWVRANATPMRDGDRIVGYLSVRTKPARAEIEGAEALYAQMRQEAESGKLVTKLHEGKLIRATLLGKVQRTFTPELRGQLTLTALLAALGPLVPTLLGWPVWAPLLGTVLTVPLATWLIWRLTGQPLQRVVNAANQLAAGDLSRPVLVQDPGLMGQLQQALSQMGLNIRTAIRDMRHEVGNLRGGTQEIASGNQDMSERTESQASSLQETAASMEEINGTVQQTTALAAQGAQLAEETAEVARRSHDSVEAVATTMHGIAESSRKIGDIIQVIEGVAFQTNILALNAAVEAARAGDAGRGFAVVAAEVRALAQRTSSAAKEIRQLIEESRQRVEVGNDRAEEARQRMNEALSAVDRVTSLLEEIRSATVEQQTGISQISEAMSQMDSITQQNAAMVEELAAASQALNAQVNQVHNAGRIFRLTERDTTLAEDDAVALRQDAKAHATEPGEVDFDKVIAAHQQWRVTLRNAVIKGSKLDATKLKRDDCCALGEWIYGAGGKRWGQAPGFSQLVQHHKVFHQEAGQVADKINAGKMNEAQAALENGSGFVDAGRRVVQAIRDLRAHVEGPASRPMPAAAPQRPIKPKAAAPARRIEAATAPKAATEEAEWESF